MRRDALALLTVCVGVSALWLACTRVNERYCEADTDCPRDQTCNVKAKQCQSSVGDMAMSVVDIAGHADFSDTPDFGTPADMTDVPPECSKDSECAAKTTTPACVNSRCVPCTRNYQCPDAACVPAGSSGVGSCVAKNRMLYVDNNIANCNGTGTGGKAYCRVDQALSGINATKDVILIRASNVAYQNDGYFLNITRSVRIVGERADRTADSPLFTDPVKLVPGAAAIDFAMEDLTARVSNAGDAIAIHCERKLMTDRAISVALRWMRYDGNRSVAVLSDGCNDTKILNSVVVNNSSAATMPPSAYAAVSVVGGNVKITNTVIGGNSPMSSGKGGGLYLGESAQFKLMSIELSFNTIADNACLAGACNFQSDVAAAMNFSIVTGDKSLLSDKITLNSSVTPSSYGGGIANVMPPGFMPKFVDTAMADYHLTNDSANSVLRISTNGVPVESSDIDSDPRPSSDGKVDVGADQRVP